MAFGRSLIMRKARRGHKCGSRRGSEVVEGMIMMLPFLALVFLIIDTSYALFINASLQYAAQAGVTAASIDSDTAAGVQALVTSTVVANSFNLNPSITVNFYTPTMGTPRPGTPLNQTGNVVEATVNYNFAPLAPLFRSGAIPLSATAASVLTAPPTP